jgi:hypothetical protein
LIKIGNNPNKEKKIIPLWKVKISECLLKDWRKLNNKVEIMKKTRKTIKKKMVKIVVKKWYKELKIFKISKK